MADVSKLKSRNKLGAPPSMDEAATSLAAPEVAPAVQEVTQPLYVRRDGRSARKTNRTLAFATRVTPEFDMMVRDIADKENLKIVEVLEEALEALKEKRGY